MQQVIDYLAHQTTTPSSYLIAASLVFFVAMSAFPLTWHIYRTWITFVHETGHSLAATLTGGKPTSVVVNSDTSGLTQYLHSGFLPGRIVTTLAGYVAPSLMGLLLAWLTSMGMVNLTVVSTLVLLIGSMLLYRVDLRSPVKNQLYGLLAVIGVALWIAALFLAPHPYRGYLTTVMTWSLLIGGFKPILESRAIRLSPQGAPGSDQEQLSQITHLPSAFWEFVFMAISVAALILASYVQMGIMGMAVIPVSVVLVQLLVVRLRRVRINSSAVRAGFSR